MTRPVWSPSTDPTDGVLAHNDGPSFRKPDLLDSYVLTHPTIAWWCASILALLCGFTLAAWALFVQWVNSPGTGFLVACCAIVASVAPIALIDPKHAEEARP